MAISEIFNFVQIDDQIITSGWMRLRLGDTTRYSR